MLAACGHAPAPRHRDKPAPVRDEPPRIVGSDVVPLLPAPRLRDGTTEPRHPREAPEPSWCWDNPQPLNGLEIELRYEVVQVERAILLADPAIPGSDELRAQNARGEPSYIVAPVPIEAPANVRSSTTLFPAIAEVRDRHIKRAPLFVLQVRGSVEDPATHAEALQLELRTTALYAVPPYFANRGTSGYLLCVVPTSSPAAFRARNTTRPSGCSRRAADSRPCACRAGRTSPCGRSARSSRPP
jgi:hypothetical protein